MPNLKEWTRCILKIQTFTIHFSVLTVLLTAFLTSTAPARAGVITATHAPTTRTVPAVVQNDGNALRRTLLLRLEFEELGLQLAGVASFQGMANCFIKHPGTSEHMVYKEGAVIGGYRIGAIQDDSVMFERDGSQFWLMLGESSDGRSDETTETEVALGPVEISEGEPLLTNADQDQLKVAAADMDLEIKVEAPAATEATPAKIESSVNKILRLTPIKLKSKTKRYEAARILDVEDLSLNRSKARIDSSIAASRTAINQSSSSSRSLAFLMPIQKSVFTSSFGYRRHPIGGDVRFHRGIDLASHNARAPIYASADGTVSKVSYTLTLGRHIVIKHANGFETCYAHLSKQVVTVGQRVRQGQQIGQQGNSGSSTGPHLHFEIHKNGVAVNPAPYLRLR